MGRRKRLVGALGEEIALGFLKRSGYAILAKNVRTPFGEIDLVTRHKETIAFVEVKTRTTASFGPPSLSVTRVKQLHIIRSAFFYLKGRGLADCAWRIDIVSVKLNETLDVEYIEIIENAVDNFHYGT